MKKCPENSAYNEMTQCCVCFDGYMLNPKTGECDKQPECPQNSERMNGRCVCKDGYNYDEKGMCVKCSANQMFDGLKCVCMSGYVRNENGMCMKIVIPTCKQNEMYGMLAINYLAVYATPCITSSSYFSFVKLLSIGFSEYNTFSD